MAKQALGRNLGELLDDGVKEAGNAETAAPPAAPVGSGVRSLMRGHQSAPASPATRKAVVPGWYLLGGDILLTALALIIVCKSPHPLSWPKELFCAAAVVLGGSLALGAIFLADDR